MAQSIFTSQVPAVTNASDATAYTMGTRFSSDVDGQVTHIRWYMPTGAQPGGAPVQATLFRNSDSAQLATPVDFANPGTPGAWNQVALGSPVPIVAGVEYTAAIVTPGRYVATNSFPWPVVNGDLQTANVGAGRFNAGATPTFPTNNANGCYFVDVVFDTGDDPAEGTSDVGLGLAVAVTGGADAEGLAALGLGLAVAASGGRRAQGAVALDLGVALAASGARDSLGSAALGLDFALSASGARAAAGSSALSLNLALVARGSDGEAGRPVKPWPYDEREVSSYPWTPRTVKSFDGEVG